MARCFGLHVLAGLSVGCLLLADPQPVLATIVFDDHFSGNSGGMPADWSRIYGTGNVVEAGTTVTLGGDAVAIGSDATFDPSSGTVVIQTDITGVVGQVASGLVIPGAFPITFFICEVRRFDGRIEVTAGDADGGMQSYELGVLIGYDGGPIHLRVVLGPTWFSASTESPPFYSGQIDYATAFATFTRDDLGPTTSVMLFDYEDLGSSVVDRILVNVVGASTAVTDVPAMSVLEANAPNPFNPATQIRFGLAQATVAGLTVHDARGAMVARLLDGALLPAGYHTVLWQGSDDHGRALPSGTYFCRLTTADGTQTKKMNLVK